jgi:hypothetical protein
VRRLSVASLDSGAESPVYGEEPSASADRAVPVAKPPRSGGSRRAVRSVRVAPRTAVPVAGYRDVTAILPGEPSANGNSTGNDPGASASGFPVALGEDFAMRFEQVYRNYRPNTAPQRAQQLAAFIPANVREHNPQFSWNGSVTSVAQPAEVAGVDVRSAGTAVVTLFSTVNDRRALASRLPGFFRAFASGDRAALSRYLAPGASVGGLGGAVGFGGITSLRVPQGGATRDITVTVAWVLPGQVGTGVPRLTISYDLLVVDQQSGRWYVKDIRASTPPMGTQ